MNLDEFTLGYIECALWSSSASGHPDEHDTDASFDSLMYDIDDIAPETLKQMIEDCEGFQQANYVDLEVYVNEFPLSAAGHDFWLTRNGHGAGFWDRGLGDLGQRLTVAAKVYGGVDLYLGDDGRIYG